MVTQLATIATNQLRYFKKFASNRYGTPFLGATLLIQLGTTEPYITN